jgi:ligand-binding sensor domain-containing protein/anti-sigma regulatory factor (Ser/Thr protein kinase)
MPRRRRLAGRIWIPALLAGGLAFPGPAAGEPPAAPHPPAERLPVRVYTVDDGLAGDEVTSILQDSRGFLWIGTDSGLSRFDGSRFVSHDPRQGLPSPHVTALLEAPLGGLLVGTTGGLARLDPGSAATGRIFQPVPSDLRLGRRLGRITALLADGSSTWVADPAAGLFRLGPAGQLDEVKLGSGAPVLGVTALSSDGAGGLWIGTQSGLWNRLADGRWIASPVALPPRQAPRQEGVRALLLDAQKRLWIATGEGLDVRQPGPGEIRSFAAPASLPAEIRWGGMLQTRDGRIWLATSAGLSELDGERLRTYTSRNGLPPDELGGLAEDRDGNLWVGTRSHGLLRVAHDGFLTYSARDATAGPAVSQIFEDSRSNLYVWGGPRLHPQLFHFDGEELENVTPRVLDGAGALGRGRHQVLTADASGGMWLGAAAGIWHFPATADPSSLLRAPRAFWKAPADVGEIVRLFQDSRGQLWVASLGKTTVSRWDPASAQWSPVPAVERLGRGAPSAFAEDAAGNLWIGFQGGGLARLRGDAAELILTGDGVPAGGINDLLVDSRRRLWAATSYGGVIRLDELSSPHPRQTAYTGAQGLSSDRILCVTEDRRGMIYLGHGKGIDQLDPETGRVRALTAADGLPSRVVNAAYRAGDGSLWFGTPAGPSRYLPEIPRATAPPSIFLSAVRIGGVPTPLPPLGLRDLAGLELPAERNQVEVRFTGISLASGAGLRYQYRLDRSGLAGSAGGWSEPRTERSVLLGNLAPGDYRFLFRAVTPDNVVSPTPATLSFTLLRPYWQRWWFVLLAALAATGLAWAFHRARVSRLVELERVRTRIAADLHDDLSSSLSRISILSELGRRRVADPAALEATALDQIGETARELIEATSDIVWAIDARRDDLESLLARIRRFASDLLEARGVTVRFTATPRAADIALRPEAKRELYLVLKEALHNAARHARAKEVRIGVTTADGELVAEVRDDGVGFVPGVGGGNGSNGGSGGTRGNGHGLRNIRERAARLGGRLAVESEPGQGTCVRLSLRL